MNKHIERIRKQALDEAMKAGLVVIGAVGGLLLAKGIRKFTEDNPTMDAIAEYTLPFVLAGGGFLISVDTEEKSKAKYFGYGLTVAGTIEGIKLIPIAKDYLSGILGETEIPASNAFYTESDEREKLMSGFGLSALPMGEARMQDAPNNETYLPELEGADYSGGEDLGYNSSSTSDADVRGIL